MVAKTQSGERGGCPDFEPFLSDKALSRNNFLFFVTEENIGKTKSEMVENAVEISMELFHNCQCQKN
ncbi:hypothetical protein [Endozoicomonas sp. YOMI1]|uniref:hypothetical protein n=1 Tax=Endozoicomonas sp. YOMI1 TaxID=2828739 RepID=UPI002149657D|nr:hypothetical protein [Endozoicomonas sp. YOMI1]